MVDRDRGPSERRERPRGSRGAYGPRRAVPHARHLAADDPPVGGDDLGGRADRARRPRADAAQGRAGRHPRGGPHVRPDRLAGVRRARRHRPLEPLRDRVQHPLDELPDHTARQAHPGCRQRHRGGRPPDRPQPAGARRRGRVRRARRRSARSTSACCSSPGPRRPRRTESVAPTVPTPTYWGDDPQVGAQRVVGRGVPVARPGSPHRAPRPPARRAPRGRRRQTAGAVLRPRRRDRLQPVHRPHGPRPDVGRARRGASWSSRSSGGRGCPSPG